MFTNISNFCNAYIPGPAKCLFERPYFERLRGSLKPGGIICTQGLYSMFIYCMVVAETQCEYSLLMHNVYMLSLGVYILCL